MDKKSLIVEATKLRTSKKFEDALALLQPLHQSNPEDPNVNYHLAWTYDSMGQETLAVSFYERAIANNLVENRLGALLGLGSTYRCLGEFEKSLGVFDRAIEEFPQDRALKVFRAMALYNFGKSESAVSELLIQLLDTTIDPSIKKYDGALRFYSDKLNETWT